MQKYLVSLFLIIVLCLGFGRLTLVHAQTEANYITEQEVGITYGKKLGLGTKDVRDVAASLIKVAISLLGMLTVVIILIGGFTWMTAGGNDEKIGQAKKWIFAGVIGLAIILSAYSITTFVLKNLVEATTSVEAPTK